MIRVVAPPLQPASEPADARRKLDSTWGRPGALAKLHDPPPPFVTGLSDDFIAGRYGRKQREAV